MPAFIGITFAILLILGVPIGFSLGITSLFSIFKSGMPVLLNIMPQRFFAGIDMFPIMAMPFFMIAGDLMNTHRIITAYTLNNPSVMRLEPPLTVSYEQIDELLTALDKSLSKNNTLIKVAFTSSKTAVKSFINR